VPIFDGMLFDGMLRCILHREAEGDLIGNGGP
jgi:hypothetical protein